MPLLIENNVDTNCKSDEAFNDLDDTNKMFDEQDASETLLMLSSARYNERLVIFLWYFSCIGTNDLNIFSDKSCVEESEVSSSVNVQDEPVTNIPMFCPCEAAARLEKVTKEESEKDNEDLKNFEYRLTKLLSQLLGSKKIANLGITNHGPIHVLEKVLKLTGTTVASQDDLCTENCKVRPIWILAM